MSDIKIKTELKNEFYTNVELMGDQIVERYIDETGTERSRIVDYEPTLFVQTQQKTDYKDIYNNFCIPKKFKSIKEARSWMYKTKKENIEVLGMDNFVLSYLSDTYKEEIKYDMEKIRIAIFDIETTTDGPFPNPTEAKYPIDAISIYDTLDDKIYVFDLIEDQALGIKPVKPWKPDHADLSQEILDKVEYHEFYCSDKLLLAFVEYIRQKTPTILTGWNSESFDIPYIMNRLKNRFGKEFAECLSPYNEVYERTGYDSFENPFTSYKPKGLTHLDYMEIYKAFRFKTQPSYKLDYIGKEETGIGKVDYVGPIHTLRRGNYLTPYKPTYEEGDKLGKWLYVKYMINYFIDHKKFNKSIIDKLIPFLKQNGIEEHPDRLIKIMDRVETDNSPLENEDLDKLKEVRGLINQIYSDESHRRYISYSIYDVQLIMDIDKQLSFLELVFDLAYYSKIPIDGVMSKIQIWDSIIFNSLKKNKIVVPMKEIPEHNERIVGAFVKDPIVGYHKYVISMDLTSLYPKIMAQVNISPEKLVGSFEVHPLADYINKIAPRPSEEYSCSPNGWMYKKDEMGILPFEVEKVFAQRKALRKEQLSAEGNAQTVKRILMDRSNNSINPKTDPNFNVNRIKVESPFTPETIKILEGIGSSDLVKIHNRCNAVGKTKNTGQLNRKILINSAYGAMANKYFRYVDNRNASAVTSFGQLVIQWAERKLNEYLNKVVGTDDLKYVFYIDTDSVYINVEKLVEKVGLYKFKGDTNKLVDFLDKFAKERLEPMLKEAFDELAEYMNNGESFMNMDREVIAMADINSEGLGAIWTGKKRYALNVYDNEGKRYATPELKIMGIETQRSSTPKHVSKGLEESIRVMLQEGITPLQEYVKDYREDFIRNYREMDYKEMASVSSANNLGKYSDEHGYPKKGCPGHVKGALAYNREVSKKELGTPIQEGSKIMWLMLNKSNPYESDRIAWESGENIPYELNDILDHVDYMSVLNKHFFPALSRLTEAGGFTYEYMNYAGVDEFTNTFF